MKKIFLGTILIMMVISLSACGGAMPGNPLSETANKPIEMYSENTVADVPVSSGVECTFVEYYQDDDDDYCELMAHVILRNVSDKSVIANPGDFVCVLDGQRFRAQADDCDAVLAPGEKLELESVYFKIPHFGFVELYYKNDFVCSFDMTEEETDTKPAEKTVGKLEFEYIDCGADEDDEYIDFSIGFKITNNTGDNVIFNPGNFCCVLDGQKYFGSADDCDATLTPGMVCDEMYTFFQIPYMGIVDVYYNDIFLRTVNTADYDINA